MRRLPAYGGTKTRHAATFKQRYEEAERRRAAVMQRLAGLNEKARAHPGYRRASTLLNQTFRKASVAQRLATLQAAFGRKPPVAPRKKRKRRGVRRPAFAL